MGDFETRLAEGYAAKMQGGAMSPEQEQSIRERHDHEHWCDGSVGRAIYDRMMWPCDTEQMRQALDEARDGLQFTEGAARVYRDERDAALAREQALAEALRAYILPIGDADLTQRSKRANAALRQHDEATR